MEEELKVSKLLHIKLIVTKFMTMLVQCVVWQYYWPLL